jgi:hypothetical protein
MMEKKMKKATTSMPGAVIAAASTKPVAWSVDPTPSSS